MGERCLQGRNGEREAHALTSFVAPDKETARCYKELRPIVLNAMKRRLGNPSDAEDLTQEVFIRLWRAMREGRPPHHVRDWVFHVARNLMTDLERHRRRVGRRELQRPDEEALRVPCSRATPEQAFAMSERHQRLRLALRTLTGREREHLRLRAQGRVLREIADTAHVAVSCVATRIEQTTRRLHALVCAEGPCSAASLGRGKGRDVSVKMCPEVRPPRLHGLRQVDARVESSRAPVPIARYPRRIDEIPHAHASHLHPGGRMPEVHSQGPFVSLAVLCQRVDVQPDGTVDLVGIVESQYLDSPFLDQTDPVKVHLNVVIALRAGALRGEHPLAVRLCHPDGTPGMMLSRLIIFSDKRPSVRLLIPLKLDIEQLGIHWIDVLFEQRLITRISYTTQRRPAAGVPEDTGQTQR